MIPENEQGVIVEFARLAGQHGFSIMSVQSAFPDAIISKGGIEYRVEFEFAASNFWQHGHDVRKCDLVICWAHDATGFVLPILALENPDWYATSLVLPSDMEREVEYWKRRALLAERRLKQMGEEKRHVHAKGGGGRSSEEPSPETVNWIKNQFDQSGMIPSLRSIYETTRKWDPNAGGYRRDKAKRAIERAMSDISNSTQEQ